MPTIEMKIVMPVEGSGPEVHVVDFDDRGRLYYAVAHGEGWSERRIITRPQVRCIACALLVGVSSDMPRDLRPYLEARIRKNGSGIVRTANISIDGNGILVLAVRQADRPYADCFPIRYDEVRCFLAAVFAIGDVPEIDSGLPPCPDLELCRPGCPGLPWIRK